jgi:Fe-S cluster assembly ATP-binding protein
VRDQGQCEAGGIVTMTVVQITCPAVDSAIVNASSTDEGRGDTVPLLQVADLHVSADGHEILRGVDLTLEEGKLHALMGPNGSGKSTLAGTLLGNPSYRVTAGAVRFRGEDVTSWAPDARAKAGMFLAFQYPEEIAGVPMVQFLRQAIAARSGEDRSVLEVRMSMMEWMKRLAMDASFADRRLNEGFSGGEKKRNEILQMAMLEPDLAVLDETDSGLDVDALRVVSGGVSAVRDERPKLGVLVVTHYTRILQMLRPDAVHVLMEGRVVESGGRELADRLESEGYEPWRN